MIISTILLQVKDVPVIVETASQETDTTFFDQPIIQYLVIPLILLILGWVLKSAFDKYFSIRPRLYLSLGKRSYYMQKLIDYHIGHELSWRFESNIKNNSKYDAYNVQVLECKQNKIITNRNEVNSHFPANNQILSKESLEFEIKNSIKTPPEILIRYTIENGEKIIIPGQKIQNPEEQLRPKELKRFKLYLKYQNERGKKFYTIYSRNNDHEKNKLRIIYPFFRYLYK
jgi:hypothetical protein